MNLLLSELPNFNTIKGIPNTCFNSVGEKNLFFLVHQYIHILACVLFSASLKAVKMLTSEDRRTEIKSREVDIQEEKREERGTEYIKAQKYCENFSDKMQDDNKLQKRLKFKHFSHFVVIEAELKPRKV